MEVMGVSQAAITKCGNRTCRLSLFYSALPGRPCTSLSHSSGQCYLQCYYSDKQRWYPANISVKFSDRKDNIKRTTCPTYSCRIGGPNSPGDRQNTLGGYTNSVRRREGKGDGRTGGKDAEFSIGSTCARSSLSSAAIY